MCSSLGIFRERNHHPPGVKGVRHRKSNSMKNTLSAWMLMGQGQEWDGRYGIDCSIYS